MSVKERPFGATSDASFSVTLICVRGKRSSSGRLVVESSNSRMNGSYEHIPNRKMLPRINHLQCGMRRRPTFKRVAIPQDAISRSRNAFLRRFTGPVAVKFLRNAKFLPRLLSQSGWQ